MSDTETRCRKNGSLTTNQNKSEILLTTDSDSSDHNSNSLNLENTVRFIDKADDKEEEILNSSKGSKEFNSTKKPILPTQPPSSNLYDSNSIFDIKLKKFSSRWKNLITRVIFGGIMISGFSLIIYFGPVTLIILILIAQILCVNEVFTIGYQVYNLNNGLKWFRKLSWWFIFAVNYFFYGEIIKNYFLNKNNEEYQLIEYLKKYHRMISFLLYFIGLVIFVIALKKQYYKKQFSLFALTHIVILLLTAQSYLHMLNVMKGTIWFIIPTSMIVFNDIMAYICGFFFGRTPLIQLSPKKTWEGFIGGGIGTIIFGCVLSTLLCESKSFICPVEYSSSLMDCEPSELFIKQEYEIFDLKIMTYPFVMHSIVLSLASSIIGPFGGFFASGFKRAFQIKDFGHMIPGHGGFTDRFDGIVLFGTFINVYISSFITKSSNEQLRKVLETFTYDQQTYILNSLREHNLLID